MEPDYSWRLAFLVFGVVVPAAVAAANVVWYDSNLLVMIACLACFGCVFVAVEGVTE
jgi:hypothetical protein